MTQRRRHVGVICAALLAVCAGGGPVSAAELSVVPGRIDPACRAGRAQAYDECGSQLAHLATALDLAATQDKHVLAIYGAEWCIWCHVLDAHLAGERGLFGYLVEGERVGMVETPEPGAAEASAALAEFAARNFVILHVEGQYAPDGDAVLDTTGAAEGLADWIPYVFVLDRTGRYAAKLAEFDALPELERRRDGILPYRGYDRAVLLGELQRLDRAARGD